MAASRALPCCVSCCGWGGHVKETARSGCDRPEPPSLRGPFPPSAGQQFRPRACLIGTCVRNQSWAVPGGPGRHRPFQWDSLGTPGARRWAAALPTAPPHTCLALPAGLPPGHTRGPPPAPAPAPVCSVAEAPVPGLWENMLRVGEGSLGLAFPPPHSRQGAAHGWGRGCLPLRAPAPHTRCPRSRSPCRLPREWLSPGRADAGLVGSGPVSRGLGFQRNTQARGTG